VLNTDVHIKRFSFWHRNLNPESGSYSQEYGEITLVSKDAEHGAHECGVFLVIEMVINALPENFQCVPHSFCPVHTA